MEKEPHPEEVQVVLDRITWADYQKLRDHFQKKGVKVQAYQLNYFEPNKEKI